ncbi:MAG: nuclear transport factor 2 family protein [Chromatiales bacterium]|jgi:uncharacterized protein|nr:nuclear transport factor 2 family protein [Chromatiales bacterium]
MSSEANKQLVRGAVEAWLAGDGGAIFRLLDDNVHWTVIGTTQISRTYNSRKDFVDGALKPLGALLGGPISPTIVNILADGEHVVLQWDGDGTMTSGKPYMNRYCWVMRFDDEKVVEGVAYLDTALVASLFD